MSEPTIRVLIGVGSFLLGAASITVAYCWYQWKKYYWED